MIFVSHRLRVVRLERFAECAKAKTPASVKFEQCPKLRSLSVLQYADSARATRLLSVIIVLPDRLRVVRRERFAECARAKTPASVKFEQCPKLRSLSVLQ